LPRALPVPFLCALLNSSTERILVVSTTTRATVAIAIGEAARQVCPDRLENSSLIRIGKGAANTCW